MNELARQVLLVNCSDQKGLVFKVSEQLYQSNLNIISNAEIVDRSSERFFMRTEFTGNCCLDSLTEALRKALPKDSLISIRSMRPRKLILMATKESHCLGDLLLRCQTGDLNAVVQGVVSQYDFLRELVEQFSIPFHHVSSESLSRQAHDRELLKVVQKYDCDYIVLAKYMRVLGAEFVQSYQNQMINIHHSFLPAFAGAKPYKQAFDRGVKIVGATAHYVTEELDEGPIVAQAVTRVNQGHDHREMAKEGKEVERAVLARAMHLLCEERVILNGHRTIVFE